jgi:hypothetical protein
LIAAAALTAIVSISVGAANLGPPLICHPIDIGNAESLPKKDKYPANQVVTDTLRILKSERDTLVRMETIRRSVMYLDHDPGAASRLLISVMGVALDQAAAGKNDAEAWYTAGFLAATLDQMGTDVGFQAGVKDGIVGYAYVERALANAEDPGMSYGAAMMTHPAMVGDTWKPTFERHVSGALKEEDSLAHRNMTKHLSSWGYKVGPSGKITSR